MTMETTIKKLIIKNIFLFVLTVIFILYRKIARCSRSNKINNSKYNNIQYYMLTVSNWTIIKAC